LTSGALVGKDKFSGALVRDPGENVSSYAITLGTLTAGTDYTINYVGAMLNITQKPVTVTAQAKTKVENQPDPALTYVSNPVVGFVLPNLQIISFTGVLSRAPGEKPGTYAILQNNLGNGNYTITYVGANLTITKKTKGIAAKAMASDTTLTISRTPQDVNLSLQDEIGLKVYPNPFTDHLYFDLQLQNDAKVIIEIYNLSGVKLARIFSQDIKAFDDYRIEYAPENVSSGILIYRMYIDGKIYFTGKAIHK